GQTRAAPHRYTRHTTRARRHTARTPAARPASPGARPGAVPPRPGTAHPAWWNYSAEEGASRKIRVSLSACGGRSWDCVSPGVAKSLPGSRWQNADFTDWRIVAGSRPLLG